VDCTRHGSGGYYKGRTKGVVKRITDTGRVVVDCGGWSKTFAANSVRKINA
jgi:hypothetical protein